MTAPPPACRHPGARSAPASWPCRSAARSCRCCATLLVFLYGGETIDGFAQRPSIYALLVLASLLGIAALGQTLVVLLGGFDLSVRGHHRPARTLIAAHGRQRLVVRGGDPIVIAIGAGVGALNGWVCHRFHMHPLIVTLATGSIVAGALLVWTEGEVTGTAPAWLSGSPRRPARRWGSRSRRSWPSGCCSGSWSG